MTRFTRTISAIAVLPFIHGRKIVVPNNSNLCLGVGTPADNAPTLIFGCNDPNGHTDWDYVQPGDNLSIRLSGTNFCLDAGTNPHNNGPAKVFTCFPGLAAQHWFYTGDDRIAITGGDQCLDLNQSTGNPQTFQCTTGNTNQIWGPTAPTTTTPPVTITSTISVTTPTGRATATGVRSA